MHFFEFKVDSNTGWRVLKYTLLTCNNRQCGANFFKSLMDDNSLLYVGVRARLLPSLFLHHACIERIS